MGGMTGKRVVFSDCFSKQRNEGTEENQASCLMGSPALQIRILFKQRDRGTEEYQASCLMGSPAMQLWI